MTTSSFKVVATQVPQCCRGGCHEKTGVWELLIGSEERTAGLAKHAESNELSPCLIGGHALPNGGPFPRGAGIAKPARMSHNQMHVALPLNSEGKARSAARRFRTR